MSEARYVTLSAVARAAGVSTAAASYALNDHPKISAATRARVRAEAERLGYREHATVRSLMERVRQGKPPGAREVIALVWVETTRSQCEKEPLARAITAGARARVAQEGYSLEAFWLRDRGMSAGRLADILEARGIRGIVFAPCLHGTEVRLEWAWAKFAISLIGAAPWPVALHRAGHHHFAAMRLALQQAAQTPGPCAALLDEETNGRSGRAWEAAFLAHHPGQSEAREWLWCGGGPEAAKGWLRRRRPGVVIVNCPDWAEALAADFPRTRWLALDRSGAPEWLSGVAVNFDRVAAAAVDLVVGQLRRNERGLPEEPCTLWLEGRWQEARGR
jgi:LacI family transcriptional regulator